MNILSWNTNYTNATPCLCSNKSSKHNWKNKIRNKSIIHWLNGKKTVALIVAILFFISFSAKAQVAAPELICVNNDTLVWNIPTNNCGAFISYNIYASTNINGPYSLLITISDPTQDSWFHDGTNNNTWYYYMTTTADCPGQMVLSSDTLNNRVPEPSPIHFADIQNGKVVLEWSPSPSPEVVAYIIYRTTDIGTIPIDTVTTLNYTDQDSDPNTQTENYYVIGMDACGNTGLLTNPHQTVLVDGTLNRCDQSISLSWNPYLGWASIDRQEIWASIDGDVPVLLQTLDGLVDSTVIPNLTDEKNYCFFIESYDALTGVNSTSNTFCQFVDVFAAVSFLEIKNISVTPNNATTVTWQWNQDAEINDYSIFSSTDNINFQVIATLPPPPSLSLNNNYTDNQSPADVAPVFYQISTNDQCDEMVESNIGQSIYLSGQSTENFENELSWMPFTLDNAEVLQYEIFRLNNNTATSLGIVDADILTWSDPVDITKAADANICYYVVASSDITLSSGTQETILSRSNTTCIEQPTGIITPNAFAPAGVNYEFRPILIFGESAEYRMTIRDRWGQKIFESEDVNTGWTGRKGFHEFPTGVYMYQIQVTQANGRKVEKAGTVTLVR